MTMRNNFLFYLEWVDQLEVMGENGGNISELFVAIKQYIETGEVVIDLDPLAQLTFNQMKSQIDRDAERYADVSEKRRKAAEKRWKSGEKAEQGDATECNAMQMDAKGCKQQQRDTNASLNDDEDEDDDEDDINNNITIHPLTPSLQPPAITNPRRFTPPSVDEVAEYCRQRGNQVDPVAFVNFYESKGWMVGKTKMKKWKAAVVTWERNGYGNRATNKTPRRPTVEDIMTTSYYSFGEVADDR